MSIYVYMHMYINLHYEMYFLTLFIIIYAKQLHCTKKFN